MGQPLSPALEPLRPLLGTWEGVGSGDYPTIDAFGYTEHLAVRWNGIEPLLVFEQRTWKGVDGGRGEPLVRTRRHYRLDGDTLHRSG